MRLVIDSPLQAFYNKNHGPDGKFSSSGGMKLSEHAHKVIDALHSVGARPLVVGGAVRDSLIGKDSKDIDVEVFGQPLDVVKGALQSIGQVDEVGASFGVLKIRIGDEDFDVSLPRTEVKTGEGHGAFDTTPDPFISPEKASLRRDFTFNALMYDPKADKILDFHGGVDDLRNGVIRHVSPAFAEDPLRVLRGAQFAARFDAKMAPETVALARKLLPEYGTISKERVGEEMRKLLLRGTNVQKGLDVLSDTGWDKAVGMPTVGGKAVSDARSRLVTQGVTPGQTVGVLTATLFKGDKAGTDRFLKEVVGTNEERQWAGKIAGHWDTPEGISEAGAGGVSRTLAPATLGALGAAKGVTFKGPQKGPEPLLVTGERIQKITGLPAGRRIGEIIKKAEALQSAGKLTADGVDAFIRSEA